MSIRLAAGQSADVPADLGSIDQATELTSGVKLVTGCAGAILEVITSATVEVSDDGNSWRSAKRGDTGAAITALGAGSYPFALTAKQIRCTAGAIYIRPLVRS